MTELTDGVSQDKSREPEDSQKLKNKKEKGILIINIKCIYMKYIFINERSISYKNVEERGMVVILQNLFFQLFLNAAIHLRTNVAGPQRQNRVKLEIQGLNF